MGVEGWGEEDPVAFLRAFEDLDELGVVEAYLDGAGLAFAVRFGEVDHLFPLERGDRLDGDGQGAFDIRDDDLGLGGDAGFHVGEFGRDVDVGVVDLEVGIAPAALGIGQESDFFDDAGEAFIGHRIEGDEGGEAGVDHVHVGFVDPDGDLHAGGVGELDDFLAVTDGGAFLDEGFVAPPVFAAGVDHEAVLGGVDLAGVEVFLVAIKFPGVEGEGIGLGEEVGLVLGYEADAFGDDAVAFAAGLAEVGLELLTLLGLIEGLEHPERIGRDGEAVGVVEDGEPVEVLFLLGLVAFGGEAAGVEVGLEVDGELGLGGDQFIGGIDHVDDPLALVEFPEVDVGELDLEFGGAEVAVGDAALDLQRLLGLDDGEPGALEGDLLLVDLVEGLGRIELHEEVAVLHERSLWDDEDDACDAFDFVADRDFADGRQIAAFDDRHGEVASSDLVRGRGG